MRPLYPAAGDTTPRLPWGGGDIKERGREGRKDEYDLNERQGAASRRGFWRRASELVLVRAFSRWYITHGISFFCVCAFVCVRFIGIGGAEPADEKTEADRCRHENVTLSSQDSLWGP